MCVCMCACVYVRVHMCVCIASSYSQRTLPATVATKCRTISLTVATKCRTFCCLPSAFARAQHSVVQLPRSAAPYHFLDICHILMITIICVNHILSISSSRSIRSTSSYSCTNAPVIEKVHTSKSSKKNVDYNLPGTVAMTHPNICTSSGPARKIACRLRATRVFSGKSPVYYRARKWPCIL